MNVFVCTGMMLLGFVVFPGLAPAQVSVSTGTQDVRISKEGRVNVMDSNANEARVSVGEIAGDAHIEGITIINDRVSIDGKEVPPGVTRYKSPKTGKVYLIQRKGGSVSVSETGEGK